MKIFNYYILLLLILQSVVSSQSSKSYIEWTCLQYKYANSFYTMEVSNDERYLALGGLTKTIIYDLNNDKVILKKYNRYLIDKICFSPNSKYLFTSGEESNFYTKKKGTEVKYYINVFEVKSGKLVKRILSNSIVKNISVSKDNKYLLVNSVNKEYSEWMQIWDITTWENISELNKSGYKIRFVPGKPKEISNSSSCVNFWSDSSKIIEIWDMNKKYIDTMYASGSEPIKFKYCKDIDRLVEIGTYRSVRDFGDEITIRLWDTKKDSIINEYYDHESEISDLCISLENELFATCGGNEIIIRNLNDGNSVTKYQHKNTQINSITFLKDNFIIFSDTLGLLYFWNFKQDSIVKILDFSDFKYVSKKILKDNIFYNARSVLKFLEINNATKGEIYEKIPSGNFLSNLIISKKNDYLISYQGSKILIFDIKKDKFIEEFNSPIINESSGSHWIHKAALSHSEKYILFSFKTHIEAWDLENFKFVKAFSTKSKSEECYEIESINFSPDDNMVIAGCYCPVQAKVWDFYTGKLLDTLNYAFAKDGMANIENIFMDKDNNVFTFAQFYNCRLWNLNSSESPVRFNTKQYFDAICFSPDYKYFATGIYLGEMKIWDAKTGKNIFSYEEFNGTPQYLKWSDDGSSIYSWTYPGYFIAWRVPYFIYQK